MRSDVALQMQAPRAHVNNTKGNKNKFGQDKSHLRTYKISRKSIFDRPLVNIDPVLHKQTEFTEVNEMKKRIVEIRNRESTFDVNEPKTFKFAKQLTENRRRN